MKAFFTAEAQRTRRLRRETRARRQGDRETRRQGDKETRRQGDKETSGDLSSPPFLLSRSFFPSAKPPRPLRLCGGCAVITARLDCSSTFKLITLFRIPPSLLQRSNHAD